MEDEDAEMQFLHAVIESQWHYCKRKLILQGNASSALPVSAKCSWRVMGQDPLTAERDVCGGNHHAVHFNTLTFAGMLPVCSERVDPCRLMALSLRLRLLSSLCSFCLFWTSIRAVMKVFFTSFSNSSSSLRASWATSSSEYSRIAASIRHKISSSAELGISLSPAWQAFGLIRLDQSEQHLTFTLWLMFL